MRNRLLPALVALAALVIAAALAPGAVASPQEGSPEQAAASAAKKKPVYWIDLAGTASQRPSRVFFTANSGGYLKDITWTGWGKKKATAAGTFGTTAPCDPEGVDGPVCPDGPGTMVLRKPVKCTPEFGTKKGKKVRVYRKATLWYPDGEGGTIRADVTDRAGWQVCKQAH